MKSVQPSSISSMTGFTSQEGALGDRRFVFELKSLNFRHLESKWRLPKDLAPLEQPLREMLHKRFERGIFEGRIEWIRESSPGASNEDAYHINVHQAAHYLENIKNLQRTLGLNDALNTHQLLNLPDVLTRIQPQAAAATPDSSWGDLKTWVSGQFDAMDHARRQEGQSIQTTLEHLLQKITSHVLEIRERRVRHLETVRQGSRERIQELLKSSDHEDRVLQEVAMIIERTDIAEELSRLEHHLQFFDATLHQGGAVGRKLEFIVQEMNRETNTLSSKAQDFSISQQAVEVKVSLEQIRELVLNIE